MTKAKLLARARPEGECLIWQGATNGRYGQVRVGQARFYVHRLVYEWEVGPIPKGWTIDHLCFNKLCVNWRHMEAVTRAENSRRGAARVPRATHCKYGHDLSDAYVYKKSGRRRCRGCYWKGAA